MARKLPPDSMTPSPEHQGSEPSAAAKEAFSAAEAKAVEKREEIAADDAKLRRAAQAGPSPTSSGVRVAPAKKKVRKAAKIAIPTPHGAVLVEGTAGMMAPSSTISQTSRVEAAAAAMGMMQEMRAKEDARTKRDTTDMMWYVRCHQCGGPGIWIFKLSSDLQPNDWAASYKPVGVMWPSKDVPCQCCMEIHGARTNLKMLHISNNGALVSIKPYPRMVVEISRTEYNRLMGQAVEENQANEVAV